MNGDVQDLLLQRLNEPFSADSYLRGTIVTQLKTSPYVKAHKQGELIPWHGTIISDLLSHARELDASTGATECALLDPAETVVQIRLAHDRDEVSVRKPSRPMLTSAVMRDIRSYTGHWIKQDPDLVTGKRMGQMRPPLLVSTIGTHTFFQCKHVPRLFTFVLYAHAPVGSLSCPSIVVTSKH